MAVGLRIKFTNGTQEQYDAVNTQMGIAENPIQELGDRAPQGPPDIKEFSVYNHMTR